jgi:hypothetical protein
MYGNFQMLPSPTAAPTAARIKVNPDDQVFPDACAILLFPLKTLTAGGPSLHQDAVNAGITAPGNGPGYILTTTMDITQRENQTGYRLGVSP